MTAMSYFLAIDVGTSRTAASTARSAPDGSIVTAAFSLGRSSDSAPSAIFAADGELLFGEAAERRGLAQPERLIREFKRRVGDDVPIIAGDQRFAPEELYARMVAWVVDAVTEREGGRPAGISVAVPVTWGGHRSGLVSAALSREISGEVRLISEPEAAARHYEATSPLEPGHALAVYDLGGGTFDAVILRKDDDERRVRIVGEPLGIADFGGADFDDIVLRHAIAAAGLSAAGLAADPAARVGLSTLRRECVEAKEALSFDSEAVVPLLVGQVNSTVRLTRSEFEEMIEDGVERTIDVLATALETADVDSTELDAILLTGGSSRIPRIAELLSERFDRPIAIDADPKAIVALGAARAMADPRTGVSTALAVAVPAGALELAPAEDVTDADTELLGDTGAAAATARRRWFERVPATAAIASGALVLATGIVLASATGLGSSPVSNADATSKSLSDWLGVTLFDAPSASADQPVTARGARGARAARGDPTAGLLPSVGDVQEHGEGIEPPLPEHAERDAGLRGATGSFQRLRRIDRRHDARRLDEPDRRHHGPVAVGDHSAGPGGDHAASRAGRDHAASRARRDHTASRTGRDHTASRARRDHTAAGTGRDHASGARRDDSSGTRGDHSSCRARPHPVAH